ncbi:hypothetical protein WJX74_007095 [Apatococcus lobatus]|uniref:glycerophosphodiester phosphodiesterase n=1 Tax=Apatococcus lobatus TaxID=904363 RepID=A0AAW1SGQ0_9CHLO
MSFANQLPGVWRNTARAPLIVSHRAGGNEAPENTIAALRAAQKAGSQVMQMDVLLSEDGIPVVFHDKQLKRATGVDKPISSVPAAELPFLRERLPALLDEKIVINTRDFGAQGYTIPTLRQLLDEAGSDTHFFLEIWDDSTDLIEKTAKEIYDHGMQTRVVLGNPFSASIRDKCREAVPEALTLLLVSEANNLALLHKLGLMWVSPPPQQTVFNIPLFTGWERAFISKLSGWQKLKFQATVLMSKLLYSNLRSLTAALAEYGVPVVVFILNDKHGWEVGLKGRVAGLMTDCPAALAAYLDQ